jgi:FixJ family two-component response regulator
LQPQIAQAVYVLEPDEAVRDGIRLLLDSLNIEVKTYPDGESFLKEAASTAQGCALIESQLPDLSGLTLICRLRAMGNTIPVLLLTSSRDDGLARHALEQGVACVLHKPMASEQLLQRVAALMHPLPPGLDAFRP